MTDIKYDGSKHSELTDTMNSLKDSFEKVITEFKSIKAIVSSDFKGTAATALQNALDVKIEQLEKQKENWGVVVANAGQVKNGLIETDRNAQKIMQGQEPYKQANGGKIY